MANRTCPVDGCERPVQKRQWCNRHYRMKLRSGEIKSRRAPRGWSLSEHLQHIGWDVTRDGCWEWRGARGRGGYGLFWHSGSNVTASRAAWVAANGPIPEGMVIRHRCDNPLCVNPDHLDIGTHGQNMMDMVERARSTAYATGRYGGVCVKGLHDVTKPGALKEVRSGQRREVVVCVECVRERDRKWRAERRAKQRTA